MAKRILDEKIMKKLLDKSGKKGLNDINVLVSQKAAKLRISPEAALVILANKYNIGTANYLKKLDDTKRSEIRDALPTVLGAPKTLAVKNQNTVNKKINNKLALKIIVGFLIKDQELLSRCGDILLAKKHFDRPINQATQVLEEKIRAKCNASDTLVGEKLVNYAINEDIKKTVLQFNNNPSDQRGFTQIIRGIVPALRNKTHHKLINTFTQAEALSVCGLIDVLVKVIDNSKKVK